MNNHGHTISNCAIAGHGHGHWIFRGNRLINPKVLTLENQSRSLKQKIMTMIKQWK